MMLLNPYLFSGVTPPAVGEYWPEQGGYYVGIATRGATGEQWYVVMSDKSAEFTAQWKTTATSDSFGAAYTGKELTDIMVADGLHPAATAARAYTGGGFADWSIPNTLESIRIYVNLNPQTTEQPAWQYGGSQAQQNANYWVANQGLTTTNAQYHLPHSNVFPQIAKTTIYRVRPVRTIPVA